MGAIVSSAKRTLAFIAQYHTAIPLTVQCKRQQYSRKPFKKFVFLLKDIFACMHEKRQFNLNALLCFAMTA
jgi:hypothetical protein